MEFSVYLYSTRQLSEALELPFSFNDISMVKGHFNNQGNHLVVRLGIPNATWGNMLNGAQNGQVIENYWWRWVFPSLALGICTISINCVGDGLRDAIDPKSKER